jgi:putative transposase
MLGYLVCSLAGMATISFSGRHFKQELILQSGRWYLAYALSYRDIEEMMQERGILVDHSTIHRWVIHYVPQLEKEFRMKKRKPCGRWRLDDRSAGRTTSK